LAAPRFCAGVGETFFPALGLTCVVGLVTGLVTGFFAGLFPKLVPIFAPDVLPAALGSTNPPSIALCNPLAARLLNFFIKSSLYILLLIFH